MTSNVALSRALGISQSMASRLRSRQRSGSLDTFRRIAHLSGRSLDLVVKAAEADDSAEWLQILEDACAGT